MVSQELKKKVEDKILSTLEKAQEIWGTTRIGLDLLPKLDFSLTGRCAGMACYNFGINPTIKLNYELLTQNEEYMLNQTIPHELAHLITRKLFGRSKPHGREWKTVMTHLGLPPTRCHNMDTSTVSRSKKNYNCKCSRCNEIIPIRRILKIRMDSGTSYSHKNCGDKLNVIYLSQ